jgi:hypothetical protein
MKDAVGAELLQHATEELLHADMVAMRIILYGCLRQQTLQQRRRRGYRGGGGKYGEGDMNRIRSGRRRYYDIFSNYYDAFIRMHSRGDKDDTRDFLVESACLGNRPSPRIIDICCGTGSVILAFKERYPESEAIGYDFSPGMLRKAREKDR